MKILDLFSVVDEDRDYSPTLQTDAAEIYTVDDKKYRLVRIKALKFGKKVKRGGGRYTVEFAPDSFDGFVLEETRPAGAGTVLSIDHNVAVRNILAREDNGTFRWVLPMKNEPRRFLRAEAMIPLDDSVQSYAQRDIMRLYDQGMITQTSIGISEWEYEWQDLDTQTPNFYVKKARAYEHSIVVFGAFENDATIRMTLGESGDDQNSSEVGYMKFYDEKSPTGVFDIDKSLEDARSEHAAERLRKEQEQQEVEALDAEIRELVG